MNIPRIRFCIYSKIDSSKCRYPLISKFFVADLEIINEKVFITKFRRAIHGSKTFGEENFVLNSSFLRMYF